METHSCIQWSNLTKLVTSDLIIQARNAVAKEEVYAKMMAPGNILLEVITLQQSTKEEEVPQQKAPEAEPEELEGGQENESVATKSLKKQWAKNMIWG